jgi:succinate dehydrogenase/fumarate reductase cytochrome b subunit
MKKQNNYTLIKLNKQLSWLLVFISLVVFLTGYGLTIIDIKNPLAEWGHRVLGGVFALLFVLHTYSSVILFRYRWRVNVGRLFQGGMSIQALLRLMQRISGWIVAIFGLLVLFSGLDWFKIGTGWFAGFTSHINFDISLSLAILFHTSVGLNFALNRRRRMKKQEPIQGVLISRREAIAVMGGALLALLGLLYLDRIPRVSEVIDKIKGILPPGQYEVASLRPLTYGAVPIFDETSWSLKIHGHVQTPMTLTYAEVISLPLVSSISDFHCVTGWTKFSNKWQGVSFRTIMEMVQPQDDARYVLFICEENSGTTPYTTSLSLEDLDKDDVLLAFRLDDQELPSKYGGPLRLVVPHKYGYKSAKWVREIRFTNTQILGFWETRGYSDSADPFTGDRYSR